MTPTPTPPVLTVARAAEITGLPESTLRWWIHTKKLPSTRPGRRRLIRRADLAATLGIPVSDLLPAKESSR